MTNSNVPVIPPLTPEQKERRNNPDPNPVVAKCGECGLEIRQTMCYSCQNPNCPWQPQTTC